jgi:Transcription regulator of the Arc/MetJ class
VYYNSKWYTLEDIVMRTNIIIDDALMDEALKLSDFKTKKETVEEALRLFVSIKNQSSIRSYKGKLHWEGDLDKMRTC